MSSMSGLLAAPLSIALVISVATSAGADTLSQQDVRSLSMHSPLCTIEAGFDAEYLLQIRESARVSSGVLSTIDKFQDLFGSRTWEDGLPMGEQMTADEANTFGNLQERLAIGTLSSLIESKRKRDLDVIARMVRLAEDYSNDPNVLPESDSEDEFLMAIVLALRELTEINDADFEAAHQNQGSCTLENAIRAESTRVADGINDIYGLSEALADLSLLSKKYPSGFDAAAMSKDDSSRLRNRIMPVVERARSEAEYARDLMRLAELEAISKIMLEARRSDQYSAPGDLEYGGTTWNEWLEQGQITATQQEMSGAINVINERIPAEVVEQWEQISAAAE